MDFLKKIEKERKQRTLDSIKSVLLEHLKIEKVSFKVVLQIPILFSGWECDEVNYVVKLKNGTHLYINSDHGGLFVDEDFTHHANRRLKAYKESETKLKQAKKLVKPKKT